MRGIIYSIAFLTISCGLKDVGEMWEYYPMTAPFEIPLIVKINHNEGFIGDTVELFIQYPGQLESNQRIEILGSEVHELRPNEFIVKMILKESVQFVSLELIEGDEVIQVGSIKIDQGKRGNIETEHKNYVYKSWKNEVIVQCDKGLDSVMLECIGCSKVLRVGTHSYEVVPSETTDQITLKCNCGGEIVRKMNVIDLPKPELSIDSHTRPIVYQQVGENKYNCELNYVIYCNGDTLRVSESNRMAPWEMENIEQYECKCNEKIYKRKLMNSR